MTEADVLRYIREIRKTCCSLDPINASKLDEAYESAAPAVGAIINSSFDEGHFVATETHGLIQPCLKNTGLDKQFVQLPSCDKSDPLVQDH